METDARSTTLHIDVMYRILSKCGEKWSEQRQKPYSNIGQVQFRVHQSQQNSYLLNITEYKPHVLNLVEIGKK
jgi:hypothetical protein